MFCRRCGTQNLDSNVRCARCGQALAGPPELGGAIASGEKPSSYLGPAIASTLCCCLPFGIISIVFASQVDSRWRAGDAVGAREAADKAKLWFWLAFGIGLAIGIISVFLNVMVAIMEQQ